ncbi:PRE_C2HC domain-containing protein [Trichonephila inaurata madagascariensis]|uniref:PRE_C2HC domain-containing protein n=1 Tax=Trichonephila inaurata madagascariensis TaxID=2747483 RepID=A0A8X6WYQ3_9ARAC|nr:PRE_C2HC domain-containing protein [Trichonephila inaurata madagascariensis]
MEHLPAAHASTTNPTSSFAHCEQIKSTEKLIKIKELQIKYLQDLIEIETFDKDFTDAAQLEALIKKKAQTELEFAVRMGTTPKAETNNKNPAKMTKQDFDQSRDDVIPTKNDFAGLTIDKPEIVVTNKTAQVADLSPKIKPVMLRYKNNYSLVLQELNKNFLESVNKLTGDYIKIQASNIEEHRAITALLKQKGKEFYVIPSQADHPLKVVIKVLPSSTSIEDIKMDLTEQGVPVIKVAQLTQTKSKFPLPIFMVEVRKNAEDAMDI